MGHGSGAHGAGFERHIQFTMQKAVVSDGISCCAHGYYLGVRGGIHVAENTILSVGDDLAIEDDNSTNGNFSGGGRQVGFLKCSLHEGLVADRHPLPLFCTEIV